jgi:hypothetical protein
VISRLVPFASKRSAIPTIIFLDPSGSLFESRPTSPVDIRRAAAMRTKQQLSRSHEVPREFNILALIKGEERYVFIYDDASRQSLIDTFRSQAADPRLSLTWFDAAILMEKAREQARGEKESHPHFRI